MLDRAADGPPRRFYMISRRVGWRVEISLEQDGLGAMVLSFISLARSSFITVCSTVCADIEFVDCRLDVDSFATLRTFKSTSRIACDKSQFSHPLALPTQILTFERMACMLQSPYLQIVLDTF